MAEQWQPEFPNQRPPFAAGNTAPLVAGAYSERRITPLLTEGIRERELISALVWLCTRLVEHSRGDLGPLVLRIAGIAVATGGGEAGG